MAPGSERLRRAGRNGSGKTGRQTAEDSGLFPAPDLRPLVPDGTDARGNALPQEEITAATGCAGNNVSLHRRDLSTGHLVPGLAARSLADRLVAKARNTDPAAAVLEVLTGDLAAVHGSPGSEAEGRKSRSQYAGNGPCRFPGLVKLATRRLHGHDHTRRRRPFESWTCQSRSWETASYCSATFVMDNAAPSASQFQQRASCDAAVCHGSKPLSSFVVADRRSLSQSSSGAGITIVTRFRFFWLDWLKNDPGLAARLDISVADR